MEGLRDMYKTPLHGRRWYEDFAAMSFYIWNNPWIGLQCFVGSLFVVPGLLTLVYNAAVLGASFGYMFRPDVPEGVNFREFVTAHGPFELTAVALSAGAGLRIGMGFLITRGLSRLTALQKAAWEAVPIIATAVLLFVMAASIEAFISPAGIPGQIGPIRLAELVKGSVAVLSCGVLLFYFVILGWPRGDTGAVG
jgi:uncharacterized membrane protein SpoIIM required for sporulation